MFYLTTHNTFYLRLYGKGPFRQQERKPAATTTEVTLQLTARGILYMHHFTHSIAHTTAFVISVVDHWLEKEIAQLVHNDGSI